MTTVEKLTEDEYLLLRDKHRNERTEAFEEDRKRLAAGEPLAYVIGWIPFLGLTIHLDSHPLIPRPETEWWTEKLIERLEERFSDAPFTFLDLCAGSGAIGLAVLARFPNARVSFGEISERHAELIRENIRLNTLDEKRAYVQPGNLFAPFENERFDIIAANPPYIPEGRQLDASVIEHEPAEALFADTDGLAIIRRIAIDAPAHLASGGELWMECDISNIGEARRLLLAGGAERSEVHNDQYGRPRFVVSYWR